jgi:hypothetical protein
MENSGIRVNGIRPMQTAARPARGTGRAVGAGNNKECALICSPIAIDNAATIDTVTTQLNADTIANRDPDIAYVHLA